MKIILNIGLNVGTSEPTNQLTDTLKLVESYGIIENVKVVEGVYNGMKERTLVVQVERPTFHLDNSYVMEICRMSMDLKQECIAMHMPSREEGYIAYPVGHEGKRMQFDSKYFITF